MAILDDVKAALRIDGTTDDALVARLIASATQEYLHFTQADTEASIPADAMNGIILMVKADYDADPKDRDLYRSRAESLWWPHRSFECTQDS